MNDSQITFIGAGNMAASLIGGLRKQGVAAEQIRASDPGVTQLQAVQDAFAISTYSDNSLAIANADVIVLAVKPQVMRTVCEQLAAHLTANQLIISIAAGITSASLSQWLGERAIVRCMPNTPALLGLGATGLTASADTNTEQRNNAESLLRAVGTTTWVNNEQQIDAVTAVSGSGPAYFFLLMEAMIQAGQQLGLSAEAAKQLTLNTALGASQMALDSDVEIAELRRNVTSPGGTTEQAILTFQHEGFNDIVFDALEAARNQAQKLSEQFGS